MHLLISYTLILNTFPQECLASCNPQEVFGTHSTKISPLKINLLYTHTHTSFIFSLCISYQMGDIVDPTIGLPFNLTLSDKEKKDRSQVRLPYKYTDTQKAETLEGRVFYEPDAVDDWDDSDPDDDLDI